MSEITLEALPAGRIIRDAIILVRRETNKIVDANHAACRLYGYSKKDMLNLVYTDLLAPSDEIKYKLPQAHSTDIERHKKQDGTVFWAEITSTKTTSGAIAYMLHSIRDISDRKRPQFRILQKHNKGKEYFDVANIMFLVLNKDAIVDDINQMGCNLLKYKKEEIVGKHWIDTFIPKTQKDAVTHVLHDILHQSKSFAEYFENTVVTATGEEKIISWHNALLKNDAGESIGLLSAGNDVTEKRIIEEALQKSEENHRRLFETMVQGVIYQDSNGAIISVNPAAEKILGRSFQQMHGKTTFDPLWQTIREDGTALPGENHPATVAQRSGKPTGPTTIGVFHPERQEHIWLSVQSVPLFRQGESTPYQVYSTIQDITTERRCTQRYQQLFQHMPTGFALHEIICDPDGKPVDYRFLAVNQSFEHMTGLKAEDIIGKAVLEVLPDTEPYWIDTYGKIALTGEEMRFENYSGALDKYFDVSAYRPAPNQFACVFMDVTERKRAEETIIKLATFPRYNPNPIIELDLDGNIKYFNLEARKQFPDLETLGLRHPFLATWKTAMVGFLDQDTDLLRREVEVGGRCFLQSMQYIPSLKVVRMYCHDITERKTAEKALLESEEKYRHLFSEIRDSLILYDRETKKILDMNLAACRLYGYTREEMLQLNSVVDLSAETERTLQGMENIPSDIPLRYHIKKDGTVFPAALTTSLIQVNGRDAVLDATRDITTQKKIEEELKHMSYHDQLTGLFNRRYFEEVIHRIDTAGNLPLSIMMADINGLKLINDSFGHDQGDRLLQMTADIIKKGCRPADIICRLGGDEFAIILPMTDAAKAKVIANELKALAAKKKFKTIELSISFGYDTKTDNKQSLADVIANAENYMFRYKLYEQASIRSDTTKIIMNTLFEKSNRESMHSKRVAELCEQIAGKMGFSQNHINQIRLAGLLHDIGKISVSEKALNKVTRLNAKEWQEMKKHPESGWRILSSSNEYSDLAQFCLAHHERWDGSGYPNGLQGEEIPVEARIINVADSYDAMTSVRTYQGKISHEEAKAEILRCAGTQFDPAIAEIFVHEVLS